MATNSPTALPRLQGSKILPMPPTVCDPHYPGPLRTPSTTVPRPLPSTEPPRLPVESPLALFHRLLHRAVLAHIDLFLSRRSPSKPRMSHDSGRSLS